MFQAIEAAILAGLLAALIFLIVQAVT